MRQLTELVERCVSTSASAHPEDLSALAQLHTDLLSVSRLASDAGLPHEMQPPAQFASSAEQVVLLVEKLVLGEADDANAVMAEVDRQIRELLALLQDGAAATSVSKKNIEAKTKPSTAAVEPAVIADEWNITEDDSSLALEFVGEAIGHLDAAEAGLLSLVDVPDFKRTAEAMGGGVRFAETLFSLFPAAPS